MAMTRTAVTLLLVAALAGCGGESKDYSLTSSEYYAAMRIGPQESWTDAQLDRVGQAFCSDLQDFDEPRERAVLVVKARTPSFSEADAFQVAGAMAGRFCPEFGADFDLDELAR